MSQKVDLLSHTQEKFRALEDTDLSQEQARDCIANISGFFNVLIEWAETELGNTGRRYVPHTF